MNRKTVYIIVGILVIALVGYGYYMNTREIYIGFGAGLSGQWSQLGVQVRNGFLQAVDDINASGGINGRKVIPVVMDDRNDNEYTKELLQQMKDQDVDYFIGFAISAMTPSIEYFMAESDMLIISPTMSTNNLSGIDDNFIRVCNASAEEAYILVDILVQDGKKDYAILHDVSNQPYTGPTHDIIVSEGEKTSLNLVLDKPFNSKEDDYDEIVAQVIENGAKEIVILASGVDTADLIQRLRLAGSDALFYANAWATTRDLLENGGKAIEGTRVLGLYDIASEKPEYLEFQANMIDKFGSDPTFAQIFGYEALKVLKKAIETADSFEVNKVKQTIIDIGKFELLQQEIEFDKFGDAHRDYFIYVIEDGQYKSME